MTIFDSFQEKRRLKMKGGPFALSFRRPDLALVLVVSVKSGPFSVRSEVWRKKVTVRVGQFLLHKKRRLKIRPLQDLDEISATAKASKQTSKESYLPKLMPSRENIATVNLEIRADS